MQAEQHSHLQHDHTFEQDKKRAGENRSILVIAITLVMMLVEIIGGIVFGSMALLADGLHMGSHAVALTITVFAYIYARRNAKNRKFSFGTGKVNALGGYSGAILLGLFAVFMAVESVHRLLNPVEIVFNQAILVAIAGLVVNGICVFILGGDEHDHHHGHSHSDDHGEHHRHGHAHKPTSVAHSHDHNLKSAYLHVIADALTSVLAIVALLAAKYFGWVWMDPIMGIVGGLLVARWSIGLLKETSNVLLDHQAAKPLTQQVTSFIEEDGDSQITDLHVWSIGPNIYSAAISVVTHQLKTATEYKSQLPDDLGLVHVTIEVQHCTQAH
ncbi:MAG: CDF family Co(II)/Ni(II) efflux transporter DmeF [Paraglaciecola sp.]|uniref:CDF family Co(II)/Ni(II) efflux transporter DmeF n=1 Tax=Paraglaciecola sp. TaxID=1920173 RepID=UPI00273DE136|nr:CDF family Co(II)/Ni(II) efflux transporter DmeF [Paraglaciecola sp.]MDP5030762.1 CDF family Co(II)/Ni(II) efflux transporter DmeF [Paraglaciecola sp.]MDP5132174.1 CDF family Co(II)/Ni(II) efflux transporter DmeF [Paraglaciecola sp.]